MNFIKPKNINKNKVPWHVSNRTRLIVSYYAQYTKYTEDEVVDQFLQNILEDNDFIAWLNKRRSKRKINKFIFTEEESIGGDLIDRTKETGK